MNSRLQKAKRILDIQRDFDRLAEWRLGDLTAQEAALNGRRRDLVKFIENESSLADLFAATLMWRLRNIEESRTTLATEKCAQTVLRLKEHGKMRRVERLVGDLQSQERRIEEARQLEELIEAASQSPT